MKMTKLEEKRYGFYLGERTLGTQAIVAAQRAFREYPPVYPKHVELIETTKKAMAILQRSIDKVKANKALINRVAKVCARYGGDHMYLSGERVYVSVNVYNLDSMKRGKLPRVLAALEKVTGVEFSNSSDYAASGNRDFTGSNDLFTVRVSAYLKDDPKACRKVVVREEIIRQPVYELVCND